ncbi:PH domain-containing protein [Actinophytocola oryzae]|uniref:Uncharacterized protein n=1 Tax=Actinophytocola oryzae TaxID=502181 RepID=A0A4R7VZE2_9PSEU|nr:PH domain-containing protein [Actinophytocola oryzae]TDV55155.1 hypothetical protein CLV71_103396 [Actinophytocola oryzae]
MVTFAAEVPGDAQLVVRSDGRTRVLYVLLLAAVALELVVVAGVAVLGGLLGAPMLYPLVVPLLLQLLFIVPVVREYQGLLGPQLAADHTGLWVRTGLGRRPEVVHLPWAAVDGIDATRKGPVVRIMSRHGETLVGTRPRARVRSLRRRFGTAFVVDGRRSIEPPDQIVHRLGQLAVWARR